jgi:hypothetical protein
MAPIRSPLPEGGPVAVPRRDQRTARIDRHLLPIRRAALSRPATALSWRDEDEQPSTAPQPHHRGPITLRRGMNSRVIAACVVIVTDMAESGAGPPGRRCRDRAASRRSEWTPIAEEHGNDDD